MIKSLKRKYLYKHNIWEEGPPVATRGDRKMGQHMEKAQLDTYI